MIRHLIRRLPKIQNKMFDLICIMVAGFLATISHKQYRLVAFLVFVEFALHFIVFNTLLLDLRAGNSSVIYVLYSIIQVSILGIMYKNQIHFYIALLIFANLTYNFLTILQHLLIAPFDFHGSYKLIVGCIMTLELLYLLRITIYVENYGRKHGFININYIDRLFFIRRRFFDGDLA